ncbi:MAG: hypothetical protein V7767_01460 [Leeuwenhoekiella sp.]
MFPSTKQPELLKQPLNILEELLQFKIKPFKAESFKIVEDKMVSSQNMYQKDFLVPKINLFSKVFITQFKSTNKMRYFFSSFDLKNDYINALTKCVNQLYDYLGPDDNGLTKFTAEDKKDILNARYLWSGRKWKKNLCGCDIVIDAHTSEWVFLLITVSP